jgi:putative ABC transport system permease protein
VDNAERQPRRTAATASALMIGLALVSALTIFATSTKTSVDQVVDRVIGAEFLVFSQAQRPFPEQVARDVEGAAGVASVSAVKQLAAEVEGEGTFLTGVDPTTIAEMVTLEFDSGSLDGLDPEGVVVDSITAGDLGLTVGDEVEIGLPTGTRAFGVTGIYDAAGGFSGWVVGNEALSDAGIRVGDGLLYVKAAEGADLETVQAAVEDAAAAFPTVDVQSQAQFKEQISSNVNQLLAVMIMLLSLAILIAVLGIVNTLVLSVIERTREIGMLRAVGALRSQVRGMVVLEALVIAVYGAIIGLVLGVGFAVALQRTLVDQGIEVLDIPWAGLVLFLVVAGVVGVLAALWPAYRAGKLDVLRAVTTE